LVEFSFKNILLPDSTTNEPLSHGFVSYKINQKEGLPENTTIENTAYIYFDFNPPIVTNTTNNLLVSESILSLFDAMGREVTTILLQNTTQQISTVHFEKGLYLYQVVNKKGRMIGNGKILK